jgi:pseudaminic acid biosynthesis-associated methylase
MDFYESKWAGSYGNKYTDRCGVNYKDRIDIFKKLLSGLQLNSILEVGCNRGHNIRAIKETKISEIRGVEINKYSIDQAFDKIDIIKGSIYNIPFVDCIFDLVFTAGVLIHIPTKKLQTALKEIYRVSNRYILLIEYFAPEEQGKRYKNFLYREGVWLRPYGDIFKKFDVNLIKSGKISDLGDDGWGFSKCHYWVFEKNS